MSHLKQNLRSFARRLYGRMPLKVRAAPRYWNAHRLLGESQSWEEQRIFEYHVAELRKILLHCAKHVPYYRELFRRIGFDAAAFNHTEQLQQIPPLPVETVRERQRDLLAENVPRSQMFYFTTGGTLGRPLGLYFPKDAGWREKAFIENMWARAGFVPGELRAVLRGTAVTAKKRWHYDPAERALVFSNFHLTREMAVEYARVMREKRVHIFHSYPSAALDFARHLQESGEEKPDFKVVLLGSENLYPGQRELVREFFGCRVFTWLGHSENVVLAGGCEQSDNYHVFPEYGFVELLDGDSPVKEECQQGELVGTTLYNYAMPLIRYRTGDWAVAGPKACACGRKHRLLSWVYGRHDQEMLIGKAGNRISFTAINMHSKLYDNVERFQFYQKQPGEADLRIVRRPNYSDADSRIILKEMKHKMGDAIMVRLQFVDALEQTQRGKFRFIVQECGNTDAQPA